MAIYFESLQQFQESGGLKATTITAKQLLPAVVSHMQRMDRKFSLQINGRLPKSMDALLDEVFSLCHLQQPFYTQHCAGRNMRYMNVSKSRVKIDFTLRYRMSRDEEKWVITEIHRILNCITHADMSDLEKIVAVHDYIIRAYDYELETQGSPFTVYTFMHEKQGVCMAYALLFEKMMAELGIPCFYVVGKAEGEADTGHAWNLVQLDDEWYHIDATWNDLGTKSTNHEIRYRYFLRSDEFMKRDHQWNLDHYPPCVSERFEKLSNLYDTALIEGALYFPHPKTAELTKVDLAKLVFKKVLDVRAQFCMTHKDDIYFSNYSDKGFLYRYNIVTKELVQLSQQQVQHIKSNESGITVTYTSGEQLVLEKSAPEDEQATTIERMVDKTVPFLSFDDSWFASYEGEEVSIAFESENGVKLLVSQPFKQLTVDILLHKGIQVNLTSARKDVQLTTPAILTIQKSLVGKTTSLRLQSGQPLDYVEHDDSFTISLTQTEKIIFK